MIKNSKQKNKQCIEESYDIAVIGAGHAGCEAALAAARLGFKTVIFTVSVDSIALMPCNPNIGGTSKGHLVRELDALGGEMGKNIDKTFIQSKMLNTSKGPAVHSLRAQADKQLYTMEMRKTLENTKNIRIKQAEVSNIIVKYNKVVGLNTISGAKYNVKSIIIATGVYLNAKCMYGDVVSYTGPNGLSAATYLTKNLEKIGIKMRRFKTGTPARIDGKTIDFSKTKEQKGDDVIQPFSFETDVNKIKDKKQYSCYLTYTNKKTHDIIRKNLSRSPLYSGIIKGIGPRYCPSIEDKVVKFSKKDEHQIFLEPEGLYTNEVYIDGMSSSLPEDVQYAMYKTIPGLENASIVRNAYAIEYDCLESHQLNLSLESKKIKGLFFAGQINCSSGYEEAAVQGLIAGINSVNYILKKDYIIIDRSQGYIGVLIDDLVTKENFEPYRMMTSRAEYRLLLRQDNADLRLTSLGYKIGLISEERYKKFNIKKTLIKEEIKRLNETKVTPGKKIQEFLKLNNSPSLKSPTTMAKLLCRVELNYYMLEKIDKNRKKLPKEVTDQVEIEIKYKGYIEKQKIQVKNFKKFENIIIPNNIDYNKILNLRNEAREKLIKIKPNSIGQASRISGVSPADISILIIWLKTKNLFNRKVQI